MSDTVDYGVRVLVAYQFLRVGQIIFPNGVERQRLVDKGWVERVLPPKVEEAKPRREENTTLHLKPKAAV